MIPDGTPLDPVLEALTLWIRARFATNALQRVVDDSMKVIAGSGVKTSEDLRVEARRHTVKLPCGHYKWKRSAQGFYYQCCACSASYLVDSAAELIKCAGGDVWSEVNEPAAKNDMGL